MKTMIRPAFLALLVLSSLLFSFACAETGSETVPVETADLVEGYNRFGIDLFIREAASGGEDNVFVSPVSVALCLGWPVITLQTEHSSQGCPTRAPA